MDIWFYNPWMHLLNPIGRSIYIDVKKRQIGRPRSGEADRHQLTEAALAAERGKAAEAVPSIKAFKNLSENVV